MPYFFRLLLLLFPRTFRARYGGDMLRALGDRRRDARRGGWWRLVRCDAAAAGDLARSAAAEVVRTLSAATVSVGQDIQFAIRMLWRRPALSVMSVLTLALALGAVTAVASLVDAVFVQPLPYPDAHRIVAVRGVSNGPAGISYENLRDIERRARTVAALSPFFAQSVNLTGMAEPDRLRGGFVTSAFFDVVGVAPALGVPFGPDADLPNGSRAVVLTHSSWKNRFGLRPDILGRQLQLNNASFEIVGVMPESFDFPIDEIEVFLPFRITTAGIDRDNHNYMGVGRLAPAATAADATSEVASIAAELEKTYPAVNAGRSARVDLLKSVLVEDTVYPVQLLAAMVLIMLVASCANVAGLQLGDAAQRRREIAVRAALGAGRLRIARQLLIESVARAIAGALLGLGAAKAAVVFLIANAPAGVYGIERVTLRPAVLIVIALVALLAGAAAGFPPALQWMQAGGLAAAGSGERTTGDRSTSRIRGALVVSQVALAALLLVAAGLTTRSFARLAAVDVGFDPVGLLTMEYRLPANRYPTIDAQRQFHRDVLEAVRSVPGVIEAAGVRALPFSGNGSNIGVRVTAQGPLLRTSINAVSGQYFETMRIPLVAGRVFQASESTGLVVVVSRSFAERAWPGANALGRIVYFDGVDLAATIVGMVGDVRHRDLAETEPAAIYTFQEQNPALFNTLAVRTAGPAMAIAGDVRRAVWSVDPDQPVWKIRTLDALIERSIATRRFLLQLVSFFGISAAALAILGLYGIVASTVTQRTREIGVRVALGATNGRILSLVLWTGLRLGAIGIAVGLVAAVAAANVMRSFLFGISAHDPLTFGGTAVLLLAAAGVACCVPAARALSVDPVDALRQT